MGRKGILENIRLPARASMWYIGANIVSKVIAIAVTPFLTRIQSEEDYGAFALYISVLGIASVAVSAFTSGSSVYKGLGEFSNEKGSYFKSIFLASAAFSIVICTLLFAFSYFLPINRDVIPLILLQMIFDSAVAVYLSGARFSYLYKPVVVISIFESLLSPILAIAWLRVSGGGYKIRIYSMLVASFIAAAYALYRILEERGKVQFSFLKYSIRGSLSLLPHSLAGALSAQSDKLIFTAMLGNAALARYSVAHSVGAGLSFVVGGLGAALSPWIMRRLNAKEDERIYEICELIFKGLAAATITLIALAPEAMLILAPPEYSEALVAILPIALSVLPSYILLITTVILVQFDKSKYTSYSSVITLASGVLLNFLLIPSMQYFGAGLALLISQGFGALISLRFMHKLCGIPLPTKSFLYYFILSIFFGALAVGLYQYLALRVLLLTIPAVMMLGSLFSTERLIREK